MIEESFRNYYEKAKMLFRPERRKDTLRIMEKMGIKDSPPFVIDGKYVEGVWEGIMFAEKAFRKE